MDDIVNDMKNSKDGILCNSHKVFEMSPEEQRAHALKQMHEMYKIDKNKYFLDFHPVNPPEFSWWTDAF